MKELIFVIAILGILLGLLIGDIIVFYILIKRGEIKSRRITIDRLKQSYPFSEYYLLYKGLI